RIVNRCLEKHPANRFQTATDLTFALEGLSSQSDAFLASDERVGGRRARHELVAWLLVGGLAVSTVTLGWLAMRRSGAAEERSVQATILPPENWSIIEPQPPARLAVSPDGSRLAFIATGPDRRTMLWVRRLDALTAQPLQGTEGATLPFWSPDSRFLGF